MTLMDGANPELAVPASATRWRRYGHDRLYVSGPGGERLGYRDLATGLDHPASPDLAPVVKSTADMWVRTQPASPVKPPKDPVPAERSWTDLALNLPGAALRERAATEPTAAERIRALSRGLGDPSDERPWLVGAVGEDHVANELVRVHHRDRRWTAIHAIPVGRRGSDIDHLVIGPGGVFTVNAKCHPDAGIWVGGDVFMVNGHHKPYVRNARHEAERASRLLSAATGFPVHVEGLIVPVLNRVPILVKAPPGDGVQVVAHRDLFKWLLKLRPVLPQDRLNEVWDMARRSTTWLG